MFRWTLRPSSFRGSPSFLLRGEKAWGEPKGNRRDPGNEVVCLNNVLDYTAGSVKLRQRTGLSSGKEQKINRQASSISLLFLYFLVSPGDLKLHSQWPEKKNVVKIASFNVCVMTLLRFSFIMHLATVLKFQTSSVRGRTVKASKWLALYSVSTVKSCSSLTSLKTTREIPRLVIAKVEIHMQGKNWKSKAFAFQKSTNTTEIMAFTSC